MGWRANAEVTVKVDKTLRRKLPDMITAPIAVSNRQPCSVGDEVALFTSELGDDAQAQVFEAAQGFMGIGSLRRRSGEPDADRVIYGAILRMIALENHSAERKLFQPGFSPRGTSVLLELAGSEKASIRQFAIQCLHFLRISKDTGQALISALQDDENEIRKTAAYALVRQDYIPSADHIADYARSLPQSELRREVFRFLASAAPQKYDYSKMLEKSLSLARPSPHEVFQNSLRALSRGFSVWLKLEVDRAGAVILVRHRRGLQSEEVQKFMKSLTLPPSLKANLIPFACEISIGYDRQKSVVRVDVY
jgi:hypothetical protein